METGAQSIIESDLATGETILWSGQPIQGPRLQPMDLALIPFGLAWMIYPLIPFGLHIADLAEDKPVDLTLVFILIIGMLIGWFIAFGRRMIDVRTRKMTFYGITPDRLIMVSGLLFHRTKSINIQTISDLTITERTNGLGSIYFGPQLPMTWFMEWGFWPGTKYLARPSFELIDDARSVYTLILDAKKSATR